MDFFIQISPKQSIGIHCFRGKFWGKIRTEHTSD